MVHATSTPPEQLNPGWRSWQSDTGQWWATRPGRWQKPMTLGPARDRAELAAILDREGGYRLDGQGG